MHLKSWLRRSSGKGYQAVHVAASPVAGPGAAAVVTVNTQGRAREAMATVWQDHTTAAGSSNKAVHGSSRESMWSSGVAAAPSGGGKNGGMRSHLCAVFKKVPRPAKNSTTSGMC